MKNQATEKIKADIKRIASNTGMDHDGDIIMYDNKKYFVNLMTDEIYEIDSDEKGWA